MNSTCAGCLKEGDFPTGVCDECGDKFDDCILSNNNTNERRTNKMEEQKQIEDWRLEVDSTSVPYLKIADKEIIEFTFLDEGNKKKSIDYGSSIVFKIKKEEEEMVWYVNSQNFDLLNQIKELGVLINTKVAVSRIGSKKSDTRYTIKKL